MVHLSSSLVVILALLVASPVVGLERERRSQAICGSDLCVRRELTETWQPKRYRRSEQRHLRRRSREAYRAGGQLEARSPIVILPGSDFHIHIPPEFEGHHLMVLRELQAQARNDHPPPEVLTRGR